MADFNLTADGSTADLQFQGEGTITAVGTFGGGTLTIEASFDGGVVWTAQTDGTFTEAGSLNIKIGPSFIRTTLAGSTTPDIDVYIVGNDVRKSSKLD